MKNFVCILCALIAGAQVCFAQQADSIGILFWNVENFFDCRSDGPEAPDREFSPLGAKHWTRRRFRIKCNAVCKTILLAADSFGKLPDAGDLRSRDSGTCQVVEDGADENFKGGRGTQPAAGKDCGSDCRIKADGSDPAPGKGGGFWRSRTGTACTGRSGC